jgi:hypothetical protein
VTGPQRVPELPADIDAWIGLDPAWGPPQELGACVVRQPTREWLLSTLADHILGWVTDANETHPHLGEAAVYAAVRFAVWVPADWRDGLGEDQVRRVATDLDNRIAQDGSGAAVVHAGAWYPSLGWSR